MSDYKIMGIVGEVITGLLQSNLSTSIAGNFTTEDSVSMASPKDMEATTSYRTSVFLYQVVENNYLKNEPMINVGTEQLQHTPLALNLFYLITPYANETNALPGWDLHTILGKIMQILYDNASLEGPRLMDVLKKLNRESYFEQIDNIRIILNQISLDDLTKIWSSLNTPMRLSVAYEVRVVMIESKRKQDIKRITDKYADYYQVK